MNSTELTKGSLKKSVIRSKILYLPLEVMRREYYGKLLIAVEAVSKGFTVILGHKSEVNLFAMKQTTPGIYFYKSALNVTKDRYAQKLKENGFAIVAQDEEGGFIFDDFKLFYELRKSLVDSKDMDLFFCWGKDDFDFLRKELLKPNMIDPYRLTGSPRLTFWGDFGRSFFSQEIKDIRRKFGCYVLFCTNFASANSYMTRDEYELHLSQYPDFNSDKIKIHMKEEFDKINQFLEAIKKISESENINIVIRPHPGEDASYWENAVKGLRNVFVEYRGDITPWILGAYCMVHNECTTGLQGLISGVRTFALGDIENMTRSLRSLINRASQMVETGDDLIAAIRNTDMPTNPNYGTASHAIASKVKNAGSLKPIEDIVDELGRLINNTKLGVDMAGAARLRFHSVPKIVLLNFFQTYFKRNKMDSQKRFPIEARELRNDLYKAQCAMGKFNDVGLRRITSGLVVLSPNG